MHFGLDSNPGQGNVLYHNNGDGTFSDVTEASNVGQTGLAFAQVFTDTDLSRHVLRISIMGLVFLGSSAPGATAVFFFSDPMMGILAIVNLLAVAMLFPIGMRVLNDYRDQLKQGKEHPVFDPARFSPSPGSSARS